MQRDGGKGLTCVQTSCWCWQPRNQLDDLFPRALKHSVGAKVSRAGKKDNGSRLTRTAARKRLTTAQRMNKGRANFPADQDYRSEDEQRVTRASLLINE